MLHLLLSTLVPTPQNNNNKNKPDYNNCKTIGISSLLGKLFHLILLSEQGLSLETDNLQFWI